MNLNLLRVTGLIGCAAFLLTLAPRAHAAIAGPQPLGFAQDRDWDRAPDAWNDVQRRGFHDGIDGAQKDFGNHRRPDVDNRDEYRHPNVPPPMWPAYKEGFRRGYDSAMRHLVGTPDWRMRAPDRPWDAAPNEFDELHRQGFRDGIEGARKDYDNHRRPNVNNRDEYRHPRLPPEQREAYRDGFRRGYQIGMDHLTGMRR
ncbi:MAG TPA: hypothetical protein VGI45_20070 [Terracidiphilus sp.]|jgi:hypothetical protein